MTLYGSDAAFFLIERISAIKQALSHSDIFKNQDSVDKTLAETLRFIKYYAKELVIEENKTLTSPVVNHNYSP